MAQRFHFDLTDGKTTLPDEEGVLADGLEEAVARALEVISEMQESRELAELGSGWWMLVRDASSAVLKVLVIR
jgi:hypothetical protein